MSGEERDWLPYFEHVDDMERNPHWCRFVFEIDRHNNNFPPVDAKRMEVLADEMFATVETRMINRGIRVKNWALRFKPERYEITVIAPTSQKSWFKELYTTLHKDSHGFEGFRARVRKMKIR